MMSLPVFLLARLDEDEAAARDCAEMFPSPWEIADRGWRVRIYAGAVPEEDFFSDDPDATAERNPVVMEVEPDRNIEDPRWLSERVAHVARHDPARVLADVEAKRRILAEHQSVQQDKSDWCGGEDPYDDRMLACTRCGTPGEYASPWPCVTLKLLALPYADHPDYRAEWAL